MEVAGILLQQIIIMFVLMSVGVLLYRYHKISQTGSKELGSLLLYLVIPVVIIKSFCKEPSEEMIQGLSLSFLLSLLSLVLAIVISYVLYGKRYPLDNFAASFSNAGFIGIPLVQAAIGAEAVFYIASYIALLNILQWTYGLVIMTGRKDTIVLKRIVTNPIVISVIIGLLIFFLRLPLPTLGMNLMTTIANLNTPVAMLVSGVYLAQVNFLDLFRDLRLLGSSLVRLLVIPLMTLVVFLMFPGIPVPIRLAVLIAASAPVGSNIAIFASLYQADDGYCVKTVCLSTMLSIITLPPIVMLAIYLF